MSAARGDLSRCQSCRHCRGSPVYMQVGDVGEMSPARLLTSRNSKYAHALEALGFGGKGHGRCGGCSYEIAGEKSCVGASVLTAPRRRIWRLGECAWGRVVWRLMLCSSVVTRYCEWEECECEWELLCQWWGSKVSNTFRTKWCDYVLAGPLCRLPEWAPRSTCWERA